MVLNSIFNGIESNDSKKIGIYLLKVNNANSRTRCEICSKLTIKTPGRRHDVRKSANLDFNLLAFLKVNLTLTSLKAHGNLFKDAERLQFYYN